MITHYIFGEYKEKEGELNESEFSELLKKANTLKKDEASFNSILHIFSKLYSFWSDPNYPRRIEAVKILKEKKAISDQMIDTIFDSFPQLLDPNIILTKIAREFGNKDAFLKLSSEEDRFLYRVRPVGSVLHIAAGNTFLGGIDSLINGIVTLNVNLMKMSDVDKIFPLIFLKSIEESDPEGLISKRIALTWWKGGDVAIEKQCKQGVDRIIFWGGFEGLSAWQKDLGVKTVLIPHGPKISFGVISEKSIAVENLEELTDRVAFDVSMWEQKACNCPQTIFVQNLESEYGTSFLDSLAKSLSKMATRFPPADKSRDEYVELLKAKELAVAGNCFNENNQVICSDGNWLIIASYTIDNALTYSPLNRTIYIKNFSSIEEVCTGLREHSFYLQTAGYSLLTEEISHYAESLSRVGVTRVCPFGVMTIPEPGTPHDGKFLLPDLAKVTIVELP